MCIFTAETLEETIKIKYSNLFISDMGIIVNRACSTRISLEEADSYGVLFCFANESFCICTAQFALFSCLKVWTEVYSGSCFDGGSLKSIQRQCTCYTEYVSVN